MDVTLIIHSLVPGAAYGGVPDGTEANYAALEWRDERPQPSWQEIVDAWPAVRAAMMRPLVDAERDRRCEGDDAEMEFGGVTYQVRTKDMRNITGAGAAAGIAVALDAQPGDYRWHVTPAMEGTGDDKDFEWIAKDDSKVKMDAQTVFAFSMAALARVSAYVFAGNAIKATLGTDDEPADITDDSLWP